MGERLYDLTIIVLLVAVPEVFLILSLRGVRSVSYELSNRRFFEPSSESICWHLMLLVMGLAVFTLI